MFDHKSTIPSLALKDIQLYNDLKDKMEHRDKDNRSRGRVGFSTNNWYIPIENHSII